MKYFFIIGYIIKNNLLFSNTKKKILYNPKKHLLSHVRIS